MTMVRGVRILAAPCCGAQYALPNYMSMNFSAFEFWTDGWRDGSLMPNDEGLRRCQCGQFVLLKNLVEVSAADDSTLPSLGHVSTEQLPECIASAASDEVELAARIMVWHHLNHSYRERYRQHRDAEEAATKAKWLAAHPDNRSWWDKLRKRKPPSYIRPADSPFTYPPFEPTPEQQQNMERLSTILASCDGESLRWNAIPLAELYREQGRYEEAQRAMDAVEKREDDVTVRLISRLIKERDAAPMRYRM